MWYGLASDVEESFFADNVNAFIGIAPCIVLPFWSEDKERAYNAWIASDGAAGDAYPLLNGPNF